MSTKKILYMVGASVAIGAMIGMLYAPDKGAETRLKIRRLKQRFGIGGDDSVEDCEHDTLEELKITLQEQLKKIDFALENQ